MNTENETNAIEEVLEQRRQKNRASDSLGDNAPIRSDDPDAIPRLKQKIADAEATQAHYKAGNKIVKSKKLSNEQKEDALRKSGHCPSILKPDFCGRIGYPGYELTNNNSNIRRMRDRLKDLEAQLQEAAEVGLEEEEYPALGLKVARNRIDVRLQLFFTDKPSADIRASLKAYGFKWAPTTNAWQRMLNGSAEASLRSFLYHQGCKELPY